MKKTKRQQETKTVAAPAPRSFTWWPWAAGAAALVVAFQIYGPALNGPFVLDDRYLPYFSAHPSDQIHHWVGLLRPLLMFTYWLNFILSGDLFAFHATNVAIHVATAAVLSLAVTKLVEWAGVTGHARAALAVVSGAIFLVHPMQVEAVAYTAGRSDELSTLFYYAAFAAFLYRRTESISILESIGVLALFGAAIGSKENALTLPALLLLTDYFWGRGSLLKNRILYGLLAVAGVLGGAMVWSIIRNQETAGFHTEGMTPATFFFTECRVIWTYLRMFFLPYGQNIDPDVPISQNVIDHGAIFGLIGLIALVAAAWIYRKRFPLASFGVFAFLLLISPVASFVPIKDVMSERRLYLPMIGVLLVCCEALRRLSFSRIVQIGAVAAVICSFLTYKRSEVWASPVTLWGDAVMKSPNKYRPNFQLAYALFERQQCAPAEKYYEIASHMKEADNELLADWALALDCVGREDDAIDKLKQALVYKDTAHLHSEIARVYMRKRQWEDALRELAIAEKRDPRYDMTYVYRGNIYHMLGDKFAAVTELQRALKLNPDNPIAQAALAQIH
ncbi:MAG: tetratricopeptide repeat protein [Acidobacteriia bacterium]|nr:tetratricopeptide repeat protein [Terriglobia bacterium]